MSSSNTDMGGSRGHFPETAWTAIINAKDRDSDEYKQNLSYLIGAYWKPVYVYIRTVWKKSNEEAKDLTQDFFSRFMEKDVIASVAPDKGRFRFYVKRVLGNFLRDQDRTAKMQKRGGNAARIKLEDIIDVEPSTPVASGSLEGAFDKEWAKVVLAKSINEMKELLESKGKGVYFEVFRIVNYDSDNANQISYEDIAAKLGIKLTDVSNYLRYTRKLLKDIMRKEVSKYVYSASEIDDEIRQLFLISSK